MARESLLLTQRTPLVSKVIFPMPNISTDSVLHTKQVINLNQDPPLSRLATGFLRVYRGWKKDAVFLFLPAFVRISTLASAHRVELVSVSYASMSTPPHALYAGIGNLSQNGLRCPPPTAPTLFFCSISTGSMQRGSDAVAFLQGDGCCGVHEATR